MGVSHVRPNHSYPVQEETETILCLYHRILLLKVESFELEPGLFWKVAAELRKHFHYLNQWLFFKCCKHEAPLIVSLRRSRNYRGHKESCTRDWWSAPVDFIHCLCETLRDDVVIHDFLNNLILILVVHDFLTENEGFGQVKHVNGARETLRIKPLQIDVHGPGIVLSKINHFGKFSRAIPLGLECGFEEHR